MKKLSVKLLSIILTVALSVAMFSLTANAAGDLGKVHVVVKNENFAVKDSAAWEGVLVDEWTELDSNSTMSSVIKNVLDKHKFSYRYSSWDYFESINGLSEFDNNNTGGWMGTLNDWFTTESFSAYNTANGNLENGDEIVVMYTNSWGADIGSFWDNTDTHLAALSIIGGKLDKEFDSAETEYTLTLDFDTSAIQVLPTAANKNYQVRTYKNAYTPDVDKTEFKRTTLIAVEENDTIYIGVGNPEWATMNAEAEETVYKITVKAPVQGDIDGDGALRISDATTVQKYKAGMISLKESQLIIADFNKDGYIDIRDVTEMQKRIAKVVNE